MTRNMAKNAALLILGLALGLGLNQVLPRSEATILRGEVKLGHPVSYVISTVGHPQKISYGPEHQVWYYGDDAGQTVARYWINEGVVVRIGGD